MVKVHKDKMKKNKLNKRYRAQMGVVADTALEYSGPIVPQQYKKMKDIREEIMRLDTDIIASGGGVVANVIGSNPTAYTNWTQASAMYDEYRVLGMEVHFEPYQIYGSTSLNRSPMYIVNDRADATALTSYSNALEYSSVELRNSGKRWTHTIKMSGAEDAQWTPVSTGVSTLYVKVYAGVLTPSVAIGRTATTLLVQFRGTK